MRNLIALLLILSGSLSLNAQNEFEVFEASITELQAALDSGQVTSVQLVEKYLARIEAYDKKGPRLNSLVRINQNALRDAANLDNERRTTGTRGLLHGIPVIVKDNYNTTSMPTTGGSVSLADFVPSVNATQVDKLLAAGAIVLAKSNLHEFARGITSISSLVGQTRNPYDPRRVPGGSSGGTAAAIAASLGAVGMGSDTCGSIRIPSAFNNLVGLRPSKGLSSIYGIMPLSHTQDVAGPLARNTTDLAIVLDAVLGFDVRDEATQIMQGLPEFNFYHQLESVSLQGLRIGKLTSYFERGDGRVTRVIDDTLEQLEGAGVEIIEIEIPELNSLTSRSGLIGHEFRNDLDQYLAMFSNDTLGAGSTLAAIVSQGLFHEAIQGALTRSNTATFNEEAYQIAYGLRQELRDTLELVMTEQRLDAIVYPPIGEVQVFTGESQPGNNCRISANSGLPAISLPAGFTNNGLPVGMELLGSMLSDARLVAIAYQIENIADTRQAPSTTPPLVNGRVPLPRQASLTVNEGNIRLEANLSFEIDTNLLRYQVLNSSPELGDLYALTLLIDDDDIAGPNDPIANNLIGPATASAEGDIFASPALRQAITENKLYFRVFGQGVPESGVTGLVPFDQ